VVHLKGFSPKNKSIILHITIYCSKYLRWLRYKFVDLNLCNNLCHLDFKCVDLFQSWLILKFNNGQMLIAGI
jgi:hypothetical protein